MTKDECFDVRCGFIPLANHTRSKLVFNFVKDTKSEITLKRLDHDSSRKGRHAKGKRRPGQRAKGRKEKDGRPVREAR